MILRKILTFSLNLRKPSKSSLYALTEFSKTYCFASHSSVQCFKRATFVRHSSAVASRPGLISNLWEKYKEKTGQKHSKEVLKLSALRLYICCVELVPHDTFIKEFNLPDTFNSWFRILELHLWLVMCRLAVEGKEGKIMRNFLIENTWKDVEKKLKKLEKTSSVSTWKEGLTVLSEQFKASLFAYDEGMMDNDKTLTGALWRGFFERQDVGATHLDSLIEYIHKQAQFLDQVSSEQLLTSGVVSFIPLVDSPDLRLRNKQILKRIVKRIP